MTTGLIEQLKEYDYNVERWLTECLPRQFGLFCHLREEGSMTIEEMLNSLLIKNEPPKEPVRDTEEELLKKFEKNKKSFEKTIKHKKEEKERYTEVVNQINELDKYAMTEFALAVMDLAKQQVGLVSDDFDTSYYEKELAKTFEQFKEEEERGYRWEMEYYLKKFKEYEEKEQNKEQWVLFSNYISEIKSLIMTEKELNNNV